MIPESNIIAATSDLSVENFPQGSTTSFPKGIIKRISMTPIKVKDAIVTGQYRSRISVLWYAENNLLFDTKMASLITSIGGITSASEISNVTYDGRTDGWDEGTDLKVMNLDFIIKHTL